MATQSMLAILGLRLATLGSLGNLAIAAPLAEGNCEENAHTHAERIGVFYDRTSGEEGQSFVAMGVRRLTVGVNGVTTDAPGAAMQNEFFGYKSGNIATSGNGGNTALGWSTLNAVTTGEYNTAIGRRAGLQLTTGVSNILIGSSAGRAITSGSSNVLIGNACMSGSADGIENVMVGAAGVGYSAATPSYNVLAGWEAVSSAATLVSTTAIGYQVGNSLTSVSGSILLGSNAGNNHGPSLSNTLVIGNNTTPDGRNVSINSIYIDHDTSSHPNGPLVYNKMDFNDVVNFENNVIVAGLLSTAQLGVGDGTALLPSYTFTSDPNTGIWHPGADTVGFSLGGSEKLRLYSDGGMQLGGSIGTSPGTNVFRLNGIDIKSQILSTQHTFELSPTLNDHETTFRMLPSGSGAFSSFEFFSHSNTTSSGRMLAVITGGAAVFAGDKTGSGSALPIVFRSGSTWDLAPDSIVVGTNGYVAIGRTTSGFPSTPGIVPDPLFPFQIGDNGALKLTVDTNGDFKVGVTRLSVTASGVSANPLGLAHDEFFGNNSGNATYTGTGNTALGSGVLNSLTTGCSNVAMGKEALYSNTSGEGNTAIGLYSLYYNETGYYNVGIGWQPLEYNVSGSDNIAIGKLAAYGTTTSNNIAIGSYSLYTNVTGADNVAIGTNAGNEVGLLDMNQCVFLGSSARSTVNSVTNSIAIGYNSQVSGSNQCVLGNASITQAILHGTVTTDASVVARAGLTIPHGTAPTAPVDGDFWSTTNGFYGQVNGATVGPFGVGGGGTPAGADTQIQFNNAGAFGADNALTWNAGSQQLSAPYIYGTTSYYSFGVFFGTDGSSPNITTNNGNLIHQVYDGSTTASALVVGWDTVNSIPYGFLYGYAQLNPQPLPGTPSTGMISIDSNDGNSLKWYDGGVWRTAGGGTPAGSDTEVQFNNAGVFGASPTLTFASTSGTRTLQLATTLNTTNDLSLLQSTLIANPAIDSGAEKYVAGSFSSSFDPTMSATIAGRTIGIEADASAVGSPSVSATAIGAIGMSLHAYADNLGFGTFSVQNVIGMQVLAEATTATTVVNTMTGVKSALGGSDASIVNLYGLFLEDTFTGTVTNRFGIYQQNVSAQNYFAGTMTVDGLTTLSSASVYTVASTTTNVGLRIPHGVAPTAPVDGDFWSTTAGFYGRVNGVTVGPFGVSGGGTVTSVGLSMPGIFTVTGSPVTGAGTLTAALATQAANLFFLGPVSGAAAAPTFRAMVATDIPVLTQAVGGTATSVNPVVSITTDRTIGVSGNTNQIGISSVASMYAGFIPTTSTATGGYFKAFSIINVSTIGVLKGIETLAHHSGTGTIQYAIGADINLLTDDSPGTNTSGGTYGVRVTCTNGGDTSSAYGVSVSMIGGSVATAITNRYGVYIENLGTPVISVGDYGIYQATANIKNYFAGLLTVGGLATMLSSRIYTIASVTTQAGFRITPGVAPTAPVDGDLWSTTAGFYGRVNGVTVGPFGAGSGTVTTVSVVTANGVSGTVATATTTPAITIVLGAITPSSVASSGSVTGSNLSGSNTGDQTITLTSDVTGSGVGSFATTIAANAVSFSKFQQIATGSLLGRSTAATGNVETITIGSGLTLSGGVLSNSGAVGTVTSVGLSLPGIFTITGSPVTGAGTLTAALATQAANLVFSGPSSGANAAPTFRAVAPLDLGSGAASGAILVGSSGVSMVWKAVSGDASLASSGALTLASTIVAGGPIGDASTVPVISYDAKGRLTAVTTATITPAAIGAALSGIVTSSSLTMNTGAILGRSAAGVGAVQEITIGSGLTLSGGTLTGSVGTVTTVSVVTANGISGSVATATSTPAITLSLGAITPTSVAASGSVTGSNLSGSNTGDQTITLTGDVTGSGVGSFAATIAANAVTLAKFQQVATGSLLGRSTAATGNVEAITIGSGLTLSGGVLSNTGAVGTVTSVGLSMPGIFTITGSPVLSAGTLTATLADQTANTVWAGPATGVPAAPAFRTLVAADIPALSYIGGSIAVYQIAVGSGANTISGSAAFTYPSGVLTSNSTGVASIAGPSGMAVQIVKANGNAQTTRIVVDSFTGTGGGFSAFMGRSARGTISAPTATQAGDEITRLGAWGYGATGFSTAPRAYISQYANENWTDTAQGTRTGIFTTAPGTTTTTEKFRVWGDGGVSVGTNLAASPGTNVLVITGTGTYTALANLKLQSFDQLNDYLQNNIQNLSNVAAASSDWVATSDTGNDTTNFVDMGINGSGWATGTWTINGANDAYVYSGSTGMAIGTAASGKTLKMFTGGTLAANARQSITDTTITLTPGIATTGSPTGLTFTGAAHTTLTLAEVVDVNINLARTVQFGASGTLATQRAFVFQPPVYSSSVATATLTNAATVAISGAPTAGANAAITNAYALWVQSGRIAVQAAATQDSIILAGRAGGTSEFSTTITPGVLTASNTLTTPVTGGTLTTGSGATNQIATWGGTNALTGNAALTLISISSAQLLANVAGTSVAATTVTAGFTQSIIYTGIATTNKSSISGTATFTTANVNTAAAVLAAGIFTANVNMPLTTATIAATQSVMVATPSGAVGGINFNGTLSQASVASAANTFFALASLIGKNAQATFNTANTTGAAVAAAVVGIKVSPSVVTTNASGTNTINAVYGAWIAPGTFSSTGGGGLTIANYYGLYLDTLTLTTMTVTNRYGIYQSDGLATNNFNGKLVQSWSTSSQGIPGTQLSSAFTAGIGPTQTVSALNVQATLTGTNSGGGTVAGVLAATYANPTAAQAGLSTYAGLYSIVNGNVAANAYLSAARLCGVRSTSTFNTSSTAGSQLLGELSGLVCEIAISSTGASGANTINAIYGVNVTSVNVSVAGGNTLTVGSYYGIYLATPAFGTATITNRYGVYQADALATNIFNGDVKINTAGKGLFVKEGSNAKMGVATLVAGTLVVSTTAVSATSRIFLTSNVDGGVNGFVRVSARTAATSFTITSSNVADTSQVAWMIVDPA